jgi:enoyl-CoA hydratase/carnithine racemase
MSDRVAITVSSHIAHVTLTRADKMNALDPGDVRGYLRRD